MSQTYFAILTAIGEAKLANAAALGTQLQFSRMAVGDGGGALPTPNRNQTALVGEKYRAGLNTLQVDPVNTNQIITEMVIPETEGGYWLREIGIFDAAGDLIAVSNCPPSYKPQMAEGSGRTQVLRMVLIVSSTEAVQLKIDPSVVLATRKSLQDELDKLKNKVIPTEGATLVGYKDRTVHERLAEHPTPKDFLAKGDGVTNDTAAFASLEAAHKGRQIDLCGATYVVDAVPKKNAYFNGTFKRDGYSRPAALLDTFAAPSPKFHRFGGQLSRLKAALLDPLVQIIGIVFVGDSIPWGSGTGENLPTEPRDGTLSDPRDRFLSPSFVNTFKRYIGAQYAFDALPSLSNWPASPSGEAIAEYTVRNILYPYGAPFTVTPTGPSISITEQASGASPTGFQLRLQDGNPAGTSYHELSFNFTGDSFTLCFGVDPVGDGCDYELYVDNVLIGTYPTHRGLDGLTPGNDRRRMHSFSYVRNKQVRLRTKRLAGSQTTCSFRAEAIIVDKKIRITNQGINGATTYSYKLYNLAGNGFGDGVAVGPEDGFVFCQLGTNDRIKNASRPQSVEAFKVNLGLVVDAIAPSAEVILMCANPAKNEDPATYFMTMQAVRGAIYRTAMDKTVDMIDNYSIFAGMDIGVATHDGLHPNALGSLMIARNIINALEAAS